MSNDPNPGVMAEIWRLLDLAGAHDDLAIARFRQLLDTHGHGEVRTALVAVAPDEPRNASATA
ncbi:hypothetical protein [Saccharopolyspora sp. 5N708]|uniref:hypothetical protein n=1 Tax=Saccharopolyspora sp. 5N708 TaxID=3457424 RepID=UPI003FD1698E